MIILGYQGVGKSTLAKESYLTGLRVIDLDSGSFWVDGKRDDNWAKIYCNIAVHLSKQNYIVLMSTHKVVRDEIVRNSSIDRSDVLVLFPALELRDLWISKLEERYNESKLDKDYKAWRNAVECYEENISDLQNFAKENFINECRLVKMDYDLYPTIANMYKESIVKKMA